MRISNLLAAPLLSVIVGVVAIVTPAGAASNFQAGRIIDDAIFTNKSSMSVAQIQDFLNSKVPACDTTGQQNSEFGGPDLNGDGRVQRWEWGKANYNQTTFPCLRDYKVTDGRSAAQVIYDAAQQYTINPQVLIVLLQKEQGLVTDTWPLNIQYRSATGYGCPDTAPCNEQYYGLVNQLDWAAKMFRSILDDSPYWYTPYELGDNYIQYNPNAECGGSVVNIQNRSTQALYNYTPYQPNAEAIAAPMGAVVSCGAYGNLNFYRYFTSWFGGLYAEFKPLADPRWMQLKNDTRKIDVNTGQPVDDILLAGRQIKFISKVSTANGECLRTLADHSSDTRKCIPITDVTELNISYEPATAEEQLQAMLNFDYKQDLRRNKDISAFPLSQYRQLKFSKKTTIGGTVYFVTDFDGNNNIEQGIPASSLYVSGAFEPISKINYRLVSAKQKIAPSLEKPTDGILTEGTIIEYSSKKIVNGITYYRTAHDTSMGFDKGIAQDSLADPYVSFVAPRWMKLSSDANIVNPYTHATVDNVEKGTDLYLNSKVTLNDGSVYYRAVGDTNSNTSVGIDARNFVEITFTSFLLPRWLQSSVDTQYVDPINSTVSSTTIPAQTQFRFTRKVLVNGEWYYQTEHEAGVGSRLAVKSAEIGAIPYTNFLEPREMRLIQSTQKIIPESGSRIDDTLPEGLVRKYSSKIQINGTWYYRTEHDTSSDINKAIPASLLSEVR